MGGNFCQILELGGTSIKGRRVECNGEVKDQDLVLHNQSVMCDMTRLAIGLPQVRRNKDGKIPPKGRLIFTPANVKLD